MAPIQTCRCCGSPHLRQEWAATGIAPLFTNMLDHGGDRGQMLRDLNAGFKAVYEISGVAADAGVVAIDAAQLKTRPWDLVLSCHVLRHLNGPETYVDELVSLGHSGPVYFFEVPDERFRSFSLNGSGAQKSWISWAAKRPALFKLLDFLSSCIRIRIGTVPPLLFLFLREHLTFFTIDGLSRHLERHALNILSAKLLATGHIGILARHSGDVVSSAGRRVGAIS